MRFLDAKYSVVRTERSDGLGAFFFLYLASGISTCHFPARLRTKLTKSRFQTVERHDVFFLLIIFKTAHVSSAFNSGHLQGYPTWLLLLPLFFLFSLSSITIILALRNTTASAASTVRLVDSTVQSSKSIRTGSTT